MVIPDEIEAKFYPVNVEEMRKVLQNIGATCIVPMRLMKRAVFDSRDNPQLPIAYIRVRDEGDKITLSAKDYASKEKGHKHQRELVVNVSSFAATVDLLKIMGMIQTNDQESKRETWKIGNTEVCIDIWPGLEPYIEVESDSIENMESVAAKLPIGKSKRYEGGLLPVYMDVYGWDREIALKNVAHLSFGDTSFTPKAF
ncbi:CYTH domain-containing protein [Candidatus Woesebacteria bacterium]|nr:CYTH domain-containing protein [Candidatus Woesebacteria bacterium]